MIYRKKALEINEIIPNSLWKKLKHIPNCVTILGNTQSFLQRDPNARSNSFRSTLRCTHTDTHTDLALLAVQVELVLADSHGPDGLDEGGAGVPGVHGDAAVSERPPRYRRPAVGANANRLYIH